jgi:hypothetical protein
MFSTFGSWDGVISDFLGHKLGFLIHNLNLIVAAALFVGSQSIVTSSCSAASHDTRFSYSEHHLIQMPTSCG